MQDMLAKLSPEPAPSIAKTFPVDLFWGTSGPPNAPIVIVGEAWGVDEQNAKRPFIGSSGIELNRMLAEAGYQRDDILCTNVVPFRPQQNEMWRLFHPKDVPSGRPLIHGLDPMPIVCEGVNRLYQQLRAFPRKLVIACGAYPLWALSNCTGTQRLRSSNDRLIPKDLQAIVPTRIMSWRGSMWYMLEDRFAADSPLSKTRLLPIIHPAAIMRQWSLRSVTVHDLRSRVKMAISGDWRHDPAPTFWAPPSYSQCTSRLRMWLALADAGQTVRLAEDIETARGFITCLGLSDSPLFAMSIPFIRINHDRSFGSWWTIEEEAEIVGLLHRINTHPNILIEGQNFLYDTQYILHWLASIPKLDWDSMLCQNVLFPGTTKALDYLSSLYCKYHWFWKEDHKEWNLKGRLEDLLVYNCWDCVRTFEVCETQRRIVAQSGMVEQMALKMRIHTFCLKMMKRGTNFDRKRRGEISMELDQASAWVEQELLYIVPQEMVSPGNKKEWYKSNKQTQYLLYEVLGLSIQKNRKTRQPSIGKEARNVLKRKHPEWAGLLDRLRQFNSIRNSHGVVNTTLDSDLRLRCSFNPGGTETHRLSSSATAFRTGMNLQNLTKGEEDE